MRWFVLTLFFTLPVLVFGYISPGKPSGFVNDFAGILKAETVSSLNLSLEQFSKDTGNEIAVVTITSLGDETIETYAEKLFQEWGVGKEDADNGLLLLISRDDREMRIEVGYGLEPVVTDIESGHIIRDVLTPSFQAGDFDGGVTLAVNGLMRLSRGEELPQNSRMQSIDLNGWLIYVFLLVVYLSSILGRSKSWWAGGIIGGIIGAIFFSTIVSTIIAIIIGLIFDFVVSREYRNSKNRGGIPPWWIGGGGGSGGNFGGGGGFGGFGGGSSGGGGASGRW